MRSVWRKNQLWIWLIITLLIGAAMMCKQISANPTATFFAPVVLDVTKTPGSTFSIDISVADISKLWGFDFTLRYNTTILTATGASSYAPFTKPWGPSELGYYINDTTGKVNIAYSMEFGEKVGFATVDAKPIAKIDFTVDAIGRSGLNFPSTYGEEPTLATVEAKNITPEVHNGFFANVEVDVHDVAVTGVTAPTTLTVGESATITVTVENQGDFTETFTVTVYYDTVQIGTPLTVTNLAAGSSQTLNTTWNTAGVKEGKYKIKAVASTVPGELDTVDNTFLSGEVTIGGKGTGDLYLYVAITIGVIIVVAIVLVYFLKIRKPKAA